MRSLLLVVVFALVCATNPRIAFKKGVRFARKQGGSALISRDEPKKKQQEGKSDRNEPKKKQQEEGGDTLISRDEPKKKKQEEGGGALISRDEPKKKQQEGKSEIGRASCRERV